MTFWISPGVWHPNYLTVREGVANFKKAVEEVRHIYFTTALNLHYTESTVSIFILRSK